MVFHYPIWLSNPLSVLKKTGEVHMYVDYGDLNKVSPKDDFFFFFTNILLDNATWLKIESFGECFIGYHRILMTKEDRKITFITL